MEGEGCILRSTSTKEYIVIKLILKSELACHQIEQAKNNTIDFNFFFLVKYFFRKLVQNHIKYFLIEKAILNLLFSSVFPPQNEF